MFTKQHYIEIAKVLRVEETHKPFYQTMVSRGGHTSLVHSFIELFEKDSKGFNRRKFLDAIYSEEVNDEEE